MRLTTQLQAEELALSGSWASSRLYSLRIRNFICRHSRPYRNGATHHFLDTFSTWPKRAAMRGHGETGTIIPWAVVSSFCAIIPACAGGACQSQSGMYASNVHGRRLFVCCFLLVITLRTTPGGTCLRFSRGFLSSTVY